MLKDMAVTLVAVSFTLFGLSAITLGLRCYVRISRQAFSTDDYLMVVGLLFFLITIIMSTLAACHGVGIHHYAKTAADMKYGVMYFTLWQLFYVTSTVPVKTSICVSLLRITPSPLLKKILWALIVVSALSTIMACIVVFTTCRPMAFMWDKTIPGGKCNSLENIIALSYVVSGVNIVTDWTCAVMPAIILWNIQMRRKLKVSVCIILSMGAFASTATLVRLKTIPAYRNTTDYLYGIAEIAVWSAVEIGLGIIAGSVATLKPLFNRVFGSTSGSRRTNERTGPYTGSVRLHDMGTKDGSKGVKITVFPEENVNPSEISEDDTASQRRILRGGKMEV